eukprot:XP_024459552.1 dimethyladenosine transferase-like [Populus trichocarpa]
MVDSYFSRLGELEDLELPTTLQGMLDANDWGHLQTGMMRVLEDTVYVANLFRSATHLRKEFAWRLLAKPGDSELIGWLSRDFLPAPKVDSSVVIIQPKDQIPGVNLDEWYTGIGLFKEKVIEAPKAGGFEDKRPSKLWNESYSNFTCLMKLESIFMSKQGQGM